MNKAMLVLVFLVIFEGFAFSQVLPSLSYEKPVAGIVDNGLKVSGESSGVSCGFFECVYKFKVSELEGVGGFFNVLPYFTDSQVKVVSFSELVEKQKVFEWVECEAWEFRDTGLVYDKNGEKILEKVCVNEVTRQRVEDFVERTPVVSSSGVVGKIAGLPVDLAQKNYASKIIEANGKRTFEIVFKPLVKTGELVLVAVDSRKSAKLATLDPWWNVSYSYYRQLSLTDNIAEDVTDKNTLVMVELPVTTWANKPLSSCNDVRVVFNDTTELDRNMFRTSDMSVFPNCATQDFNLFFNLDQNLNGTDSTNYKVYYGNAAATVPSFDFNPVNNFAIPDKNILFASALGTQMMDNLDGVTLGVSSTSGWPVGTFGLSAGFDATASINYNTAGWYAAFDNTNHTIEFWYMKTATPAGNEGILSLNRGGDGEEILKWSSASNLQYSRNKGTYVTCNLGDFSENVWHYIAVTYSSTIGMKGYVDNNMTCSNSDATQLNADGGDVFGLGKVGAVNNVAQQIDGLKITQGVKTVFPNGKVNSKARQVSASVGVEVAGSTADFNHSFHGGRDYLDAELGLNSVIVDFNDISVMDAMPVVDWNWFVDGVKVSDDQNFVRTFTTVGDFNVELKVRDTGGNNGVGSEIISILQAVQSLKVNFDSSSVSSADANISFDLNATYDGNADTFWWLKNYSIIGSGSAGIHRMESSNGDFNYCVTIQTVGSDVNKTACLMVSVTQAIIKIPKDESSLALISPFRLAVDVNTAVTDANLTSDTNIWVVNLQTAPIIKTVTVSADGYSERSYTFNSDGELYIIQPYLLSGTAINHLLIVYDAFTKRTLSGAQISIKKIISSVMTEVSSLSTDDKGEAQGSFIAGGTYYFDINYGNFYKRFTIRPYSSSTISFLLDLNNGSIDYNLPAFGKVDFTVTRNGDGVSGILLPIGENYDFNVNASVTGYNLTIISVTGTLKQGLNTLSSITDNSSPFLLQFSIPASSTQAGRMMELTVTIVTSEGTFTEKRLFKPQSTGLDRLSLLQNVKKDIGDSGALLVSIILTLLIVSVLHQKITDNYDVLGLITAMILGIFTYLTWVPLTLWLFVTFAAVMMMARRYI